MQGLQRLQPRPGTGTLPLESSPCLLPGATPETLRGGTWGSQICHTTGPRTLAHGSREAGPVTSEKVIKFRRKPRS